MADNHAINTQHHFGLNTLTVLSKHVFLMWHKLHDFSTSGRVAVKCHTSSVVRNFVDREDPCSYICAVPDAVASSHAQPVSIPIASDGGSDPTATAKATPAVALTASQAPCTSPPAPDPSREEAQGGGSAAGGTAAPAAARSRSPILGILSRRERRLEPGSPGRGSRVHACAAGTRAPHSNAAPEPHLGGGCDDRGTGFGARTAIGLLSPAVPAGDPGGDATAPRGSGAGAPGHIARDIASPREFGARPCSGAILLFYPCCPLPYHSVQARIKKGVRDAALP